MSKLHDVKLHKDVHLWFDEHAGEQADEGNKLAQFTDKPHSTGSDALAMLASAV